MPTARRPSTKGLSGLELQVLSTIDEHHMLDAGQRVAVACSGGADSTALLMILLHLSQRFGWVVSVAHFNHQLRGVESDEDERFVGGLAETNHAAFFCTGADVRREAERSHANLEATARRLRYQFFHSLVSSGKVDRVAVGHTADDQAETVLLRLIRGAGMRGLTSIRPALSSGIIRPLIGIRGPQLRAWLKSRSVAWREDASNRDLRLRRNLVRESILPMLAEINPSIIDALARTAALSRLDECFWTRYTAYLAARYARVEHGTISIERKALRRLPRAAGYRLLQWSLNHAVTGGSASSYPQIRSLFDWAVSPHGVRLALPQNLAAGKSFSHLMIARKPSEGQNGKEQTSYSQVLPLPGSLKLQSAGIECSLEFVNPAAAGAAYNNGEYAFFDQSLLKSPLTLRNWKAGDAYCPDGRHKSWKLKDLFQRSRIPSHARSTWPVLEAAGGIVWARKFGVARGFKPQVGSSQAVCLRIRELVHPIDSAGRNI